MYSLEEIKRLNALAVAAARKRRIAAEADRPNQNIGSKIKFKEWLGIRCKYCGTNLVRGKCPVNKKDCGR